jgi:hypothetical protein
MVITGLHEFSHVIGLYHEHIRKDKTEPDIHEIIDSDICAEISL